MIISKINKNNSKDFQKNYINCCVNVSSSHVITK